MIVVEILGGFVAYLVGAVMAACLFTNFWESRTYGTLDPGYVFGTLFWPLGIPLMLSMAALGTLSSKLPERGWIGRGIAELISKRKQYQKTIEQKDQYIDELERRFRELEGKTNV